MIRTILMVHNDIREFAVVLVHEPNWLAYTTNEDHRLLLLFYVYDGDDDDDDDDGDDDDDDDDDGDDDHEMSHVYDKLDKDETNVQNGDNQMMNENVHAGDADDEKAVVNDRIFSDNFH
jgi:hypothetical protein